MPHEYDRFWSLDRIKIFMESFPLAVGRLNWSPEDVPGVLLALADEELNEDIIPSEETCRRIIKKGHTPRKWFLTGLLIGVVKHIKGMGDVDPKNVAEYGNLVSLFDSLQEHFISKKYKNPEKKRKRNRVDESLDLISVFLGVDNKLFADIESKLFIDSDESNIYFDSYRFSSTPGYVKKSFTVLHRPTEIIPLVRFANFIEHKGRIREARGVVVPFRNQLALIGHADKGKGIKLVVIEDTEGPQNEYHGLLNTIEPDGTPVAARILFSKSPHMNHTDAGAREYKVTELSKLEIEKIESIRNRMWFTIEKELYSEKGEVLEQRDIVHMIDRYLHDGKKYKIVDKDGKPFNPAHHDYYTFNSALKLRE